MKGKHDEGHIRYQPPSAAELVRYPPRNSVCARYRGMLRDYADQDLSPRDRAAVDDHLHACRDCSLALARAEHEVLRIRTALTGLRPGLEATSSAGPARPPAGFTAAVLQRLHERPPAPAAKRHRWWILVPVAAALVVGVRLGQDVWNREHAGPRVTVRAAADTAWLRGDVAAAVRVGETRPRSGLLRVGPAGHVQLSIEPDSVFDVEGDSLMQLAPSSDRGGARSTLYHGAVAVVSGMSWSGEELEIPGAGLIRLGSGRYHVSAVPYLRFDAALTPETLTRVRLEVLSGQPAEVMQSASGQDGPMRRVLAGEVARFDGWSPVVVGPALDEQRLVAALRSRAEPADPGTTGTPGLWLGRVTDPSGVGLSSATVHVGSSLGSETVVTDSDGRFSSTDLERLRGEEIVLQVTPPLVREGQRSLAVYGPVPRRLRESPDGDGYLAGSVRLEPERAVTGRIRDEDFRSVSGARVVPLVMDELLGVVQPLWALAGLSNADGEFALHRLPATLEPHMSLVLLIDHADHVPMLSFALAGTPPSPRDRLIDLQLSRGERAEIPDLPPDQSLDVGLSLPGLAPDTIVWIRALADEGGRAALQAGERASLWLRSGSAGTEAPTLEALTVGPGGLAVPVPSRQSVALLPEDWEGRGRLRVAGSHRYGKFGRAGAGRPVVFSVVDAQTNAARGNTRLLLLPDRGPAVYLGEYDALTGFSATLPTVAARILAVGPDGSTGLLEVEADSPERVQVKTRDSGSLVLAAGSFPDLQGPDALDLELQALDGPLPGRMFTRRVLRDQDWETSGLVPGLYRVTAGQRTGSCLVEPGRTTPLSLRD